MCGICGHLSFDRERRVDRELLGRMNGTLFHRGPDSEGYYVNGHIGLAMRRLAIIDVAGEISLYQTKTVRSGCC